MSLRFSSLSLAGPSFVLTGRKYAHNNTYTVIALGGFSVSWGPQLNSATAPRRLLGSRWIGDLLNWLSTSPQDNHRTESLAILLGL